MNENDNVKSNTENNVHMDSINNTDTVKNTENNENDSFSVTGLLIAGMVVFVISQFAYMFLYDVNKVLFRIIGVVCIVIIFGIYACMDAELEIYSASLMNNLVPELIIGIIIYSCAIAQGLENPGEMMSMRLELIVIATLAVTLITLIRKRSFKKAVFSASQIFLIQFMMCCIGEVIGENILVGIGEVIILILIIMGVLWYHDRERARYEAMTPYEKEVYDREKAKQEELEWNMYVDRIMRERDK